MKCDLVFLCFILLEDLLGMGVLTSSSIESLLLEVTLLLELPEPFFFIFNYFCSFLDGGL
jgi:hypothetical protein